MSSPFLPASAYAERLGFADADELPDWLPEISPDFLVLADRFDATREDGRYGERSLAFAMDLEPWNGRSVVVLWALLRALLGQPGGSALFRRETLDGVRWSDADALWIASMTPAKKATSHLILAAVESMQADELPLAAPHVARLREVVTDAGLIERLDTIDARIAEAPRPEDLLDPLFAERVAATLNRPIRELIFRCALNRPERPSWWWRDSMKRLTNGHEYAVQDILKAIPAHLAEHGRFSRGEDTLRGLIFVADAFEKGWIIPVFRDIILAAGGTRPPRSQKLANAAVEALYYHDKSRSTLEDLRKRVPGKALQNRIDTVLEYM
ncbi:hypothetical protein [Phytomonospora endophytica]|uniref:Uncharacterized protein n=1 Tax=Phytomonospora endophytica TaxID=714109 RepID=A0A841FDA8_9ACTN|nr:hypothetical protein [Phytomonospora endophytica]MBB6033425.1 hypothetical protein [Phytomonospora endophytica]GIG70804.1 hypothetical protein Pen01_70990 [Phytomonospora endophytica]